MARVYSTDKGRLCPQCLRAQAECVCPAHARPRRETGPVRIRLERKGRGGKEVSVVSGLPLPDDALAKFGKTLKKQCGTGGTVKDGEVELQGDHRQKLLQLLDKAGYPAKLAGG